MKTLILAAVAASLVIAAGPASARGLGEAAEAEAARAKSRAGGPTNYRDAELLIRYGGCPDYVRGNAFCDSIRHHQRHEPHHRRRHYD